jgi:hypothetical protein
MIPNERSTKTRENHEASFRASSWIAFIVSEHNCGCAKQRSNSLTVSNTSAHGKVIQFGTGR